jgi:histone H3/H4
MTFEKLWVDQIFDFLGSATLPADTRLYKGRKIVKIVRKKSDEKWDGEMKKCLSEVYNSFNGQVREKNV